MRFLCLLLGYYMYMEASFIPPGTLFQLQTTDLYQTLGAGPYTMSFWYHMYGMHMGNLNIYGIAGTQKTRLLTIPGGNLRGKHTNTQTQCYQSTVTNTFF